jgi:hypothetical protein
MGFSEKAKEYFYDQMEFDNREISKKMEGYSESLLSRYLNQDKISPTFVLKIKKYFPEAPIDQWINENNLGQANEAPTAYTINPLKKINKMIQDLEELKVYFKQEMSQK